MLPAQMSQQQKEQVFVVANNCFQIIAPADEEDDEFAHERKPSTQMSNVDMDISFRQKEATGSIMRKKSTLRLKNLNSFQRERLAQQNALLKELEAAMKEVPAGVEIWQIQNEDGQTLLHQAAQSDQPVIFRRLLKMARERIGKVEEYKDKGIMQQWVNKKSTQDMFVALHFASFNGNLEICQMLIEEGADY